MHPPEIRIKRAYEPAGPKDGFRVLVDRLWPRGIAKHTLRIDYWLKNAAPSTELRKWFNHEPEHWAQFRKAYLAELRGHKDDLRSMLRDAASNNITLIYGARDEKHNHAIVLREYLKRLRARPSLRRRA